MNFASVNLARRFGCLLIVGLLIVCPTACTMHPTPRPLFVAQVWESGNPHFNHRFKGGPSALDYCQILLYDNMHLHHNGKFIDNGDFILRQQISYTSNPLAPAQFVEYSGTWKHDVDGKIILICDDRTYSLPPPAATPGTTQPYFPAPVVFLPANIHLVYKYPANPEYAKP